VAEAFRLSPRARQDLETIWRYSAAEWGFRQADLYALQLNERFGMLAANPAAGRREPRLRQPVRIFPFASHVIAYRETGEGVEIVRVLHARRDWPGMLGD
jgi:toxin ParE1/3/4